MTDRSTLDRLGWLHLAPWPRFAGLGLLMLAVALTEGLGLLLLVPLLGLMAPGAEGGRIAIVFEQFGLSPQLNELLALFVALVALRAALVYARGQSALRMEIALADGLRRRAWDALLHCDWRELAGLRRADSASLLITEIDRSGICINQAIAALAIAVTLAGLGLAAFAISPDIAGGALLAGLMLIVLGQGIRRRSALFGAALGQAYAEAGRFDDAIRVASRVLEIAGPAEPASPLTNRRSTLIAPSAPTATRPRNPPSGP